MSDRLHEIFQHQRQLMERFHVIERANLPHLPEFPVPFDYPTLTSVVGQLRLKEYAWRIVEELTEAGQHLRAGGSDEDSEYREEIADAFHFLVELWIQLGTTPAHLVSRTHCQEAEGDSLSALFAIVDSLSSIDRLDSEEELLSVVMALGLFSNQLKNRPWKQKLTVPNQLDVYLAADSLVFSFIRLCRASRMTADDLYNHYMRKNQINSKRIEGGK